MRFLNLIDFNSRPSARGDFVRRSSEGVQSRFQFTPLREGRRQRPPHPTIAMPFQFTPLREGRPGIQQDALSGILFQFTPLREGRHLPRGCFLRQLNFNSRPSARGDMQQRAPQPLRKFQFTPLREGRPRPTQPV